MYALGDVAHARVDQPMSRRAAFRELARAGVRTVGRFHYVHHQADGTPTPIARLLSDVVIEAARDAGLRDALLRVAVYHRAGAGKRPRPGQRRFCDPTRSTTSFATSTPYARKYKDAPTSAHRRRAALGSRGPALVARAHRARTRRSTPAASHARRRAARARSPSASPRRVAARSTSSPTTACSADRFAAVHCHAPGARRGALLGERRGAFACICATTERDLGDGLPEAGRACARRVRLCTGIDSHVITNPLDELPRTSRPTNVFAPGRASPISSRNTHEQLLAPKAPLRAPDTCTAGHGRTSEINRDPPNTRLVFFFFFFFPFSFYFVLLGSVSALKYGETFEPILFFTPSRQTTHWVNLRHRRCPANRSSRSPGFNVICFFSKGKPKVMLPLTT